eukprot:425353_1
MTAFYYASCLFVVVLGLALGGLRLDTLDATDAALAERGGISERDVALGAGADDEGGDRDDLLGDGDVALLDEDAGVVDGLGETDLEADGLEAALQNVGDGQGKHVIELVLVGVEEAEVVAAAEKGGTLELATGVVLGQGQEETGGTTHLGEDDVDTPDLTLAAEAVLSAQAELAVETLRLERTTGGLEDRVKVAVVAH